MQQQVTHKMSKASPRSGLGDTDPYSPTNAAITGLLLSNPITAPLPFIWGAGNPNVGVANQTDLVTNPIGTTVDTALDVENLIVNAPSDSLTGHVASSLGQWLLIGGLVFFGFVFVSKKL